MALCGATSSTLPLWAAWDAPELQFVTPNLATDGTGGGLYYIYHVATQKFMANGANFNTQLVVADEGQEVTLSYGEDYELSRRPETDTEYSTAKGWRLSMMNAPTNGGFHEVYITNNGSEAYVDHNKQGHILWKIVSEGETYRIKVIDEDKTYGITANDGLYANSYMSVNEGGTTVSPLIDKNTAGFENAEQGWKFVAPEVYEAYQAKLELKKQLEAADEAGFTDYEKYAAIYNSPDAQAEDITTAVAELAQAIVNWQSSQATPEQPKDFSNMIANNSFADGNNGWTDVSGGLGHQTGTAYSTPEGENKMEYFSEKWVTSANNGNLGNNPMHIQQTLENMPTGRYRLTANTIGYWQGDWQNTVPNGVYVYAVNSGIEYRAEAHTVEFGGLANDVAGEGTPSPRKTELEFVTIDGNLEIGFKTVNTNCNWVAVDNFKLEYLGAAEGEMANNLQKCIEEAEALKESYASQNTAYSIEGGIKFDNVLKSAREAVSQPDIDDKTLGLMLTSVQAAMDTLRADVAAYETLSKQITNLETAYEETPYADKGLPAYDEYLDLLTEGYNQKTFKPSEVDSIQPRADRIFKAAVVEALNDGTTNNVTGLLTNPNFDKSNNGWTKTGDGDFKNDNTNVSEVWNGKDWEVYQELTGLPEGSYKITMQGFYSPSSGNANSWHEGWGQEGDRTNDVLGYFFGNDAAEKLLHVTACPQDENVAENCEEVTWTDDASLAGKWLCHGKNSAQEIFEASSDNYLNTATCYVGEDGKLRLGVKLSGVTWGQSWVVFDNFQVEYLGAEDMTGATSTINALIAQAQEMANDEETLTTAEAKEVLNAAIAAANKAIAEGLDQETYKEQTASLKAAIEDGQKAQKAASQFDALVTEQLNNFDLGAYDEYGETEEYGTFQDLLYDEMEPALEALESVAWIEEATTKINEAYARMIATTVDTSGASINTPTDMTALIQSPSFSAIDPESSEEVASIKGWVTTEGNNANATSALNYEFIVGKGDADIHQTLYALPKGYYRLTYNGFYRAGGYIEAAVAHRDSTDALNAQAYVEAGDGKWEKPLASIFDNVSEFKYDAGDVALSDTLFNDNLLYHFIVNGINGAKATFDEGLYEGNFSFYVSEDGQPTVIGVRKKEVIPNDWAIFDNFRLIYYGDGDANKPEDFTSSIGETKTEGTAKVVSSAWYTLNGVRVAEPKQRGIYIRQDLMDDGTRKSVKVMIK